MKVIYSKEEAEGAKLVGNRFKELIGQPTNDISPLLMYKDNIKVASVVETDTEIIVEYKPEFSQDVISIGNIIMDIIEPFIPMVKGFITLMKPKLELLQEKLDEFQEKWL
jgi:hypothetical protein